MTRVHRSALVICTLNRPNRIAALLKAIEFLPSRPNLTIVVDSSLSDETEKVVGDFISENSLQVIFLKSDNGAAHQKNVGLDYLERESGLDFEVVHFLDDDVIPSGSYFERCYELFKSQPNAVVVGGFDESLTQSKPSVLRDLAGLARGSKSGLILSSGICLVPFPSKVA